MLTHQTPLGIIESNTGDDLHVAPDQDWISREAVMRAMEPWPVRFNRHCSTEYRVLAVGVAAVWIMVMVLLATL